MTNWKKTFGIHICCSVLVVAFLIAVPILSSAQPSGEAVAEATSQTEITRDPLKRLPASPEEAHQRLEDREVAWPDDAAEGDFGAAALIEGVQAGLRIAIPYDTVEGFVTNAGANVKVELIRGGPVIQTVTKTAQADGWFKADLSAGDIQSGDQVRVTDLTSGAPVTVDCTLTGNIDFNNNWVSGSAIAGNIVDINIISPSTYYADVPPGAARRQVGAGPGGAYLVPFGLDLRAGDAAYVFSTNPNGHRVMNVAAGSGAGLVVYPQYDDVLGYYQPGTAMTVTAGTASRNVTTLGDGFFEAWFSNHDIVPGETVAANMGGARSIIVRDISAKCDPAANVVSGMAPANRPIRVTMDPYGTPVVYEILSNGQGAFEVSLGSAFTATGTEVYNVTWYDDDGDAVVYEFQTFSWYLAEGYTGGSFDTWVLVQNPGPDDAAVTMTFQLTAGTAPAYSFVLPAGKRQSVHVDELPGLADAQVSSKVTSVSGNWIIAERAVYFDYNGKPGGHDSIGALTPSNTWYLAEGYTGGDFDEWVLVQNPGTQMVTVTMTFQLTEGSAPSYTFQLPGLMRRSVHVDELPGLANAQVSTQISSDYPVVAERAMYFNYNGKKEGHDSIGVIASANEWYLAEGYTGGDFDEWILVQNPGTQLVTVTMTFQLTKGTAPQFTFQLPGGMRRSVHVDELPGLADAEVSTKITSDFPVVPERAMYFTYDGKPGGHDSIGTVTPSPVWYLAEGYTGGQFDEWILVQNPQTETARVTLTFQLVSGSAPDYTFDLPGGMRKSVHVDELAGLADAEVSTKVIATNAYGQPLDVVAERAMYFIYEGKPGGHDSIGVPEIFK